MISVFIKGINQLSDKATRKYLWFSILSALITFIALWSLIGWVLSETSISQIGWLEGIIDVLGGVATFALTWFLFPATVSAVIGLFLDQVAECVEKRHYPGLPRTNGLPVGEGIVMSLKFVGILIVLNILMLPFLFLGPVFPRGFLSRKRVFTWTRILRVCCISSSFAKRSHQVTQRAPRRRSCNGGHYCIFFNDPSGKPINACCCNVSNGAFI